MKTVSDSSTFDWTLLRSFLAVLDSGSLLAASRRLGVAQPTVGRHMDELELQLKVSLFERTARGLVPTAMARQLAEPARAMQASADDLQRCVDGAATQVAGTVRLTASQTVASYVLPPLLLQLRKVAPEIQIELVSTNEVKNLQRREADVAIRMLRPEQASLIAKKIGEIGVACYAHSSYLKKAGVPKNIKDLLRHSLVGYDQDDAILRGFREHYGAQVNKEMFAFRTDDHICYFRAVLAGLGIGFISPVMASKERGLVRVLPELVIASLPVWLTTHREIHGNPRIRTVFDFVATHFNQYSAPTI
jgi:DNA-binding transcriptional LysR family regulator